MNSRYLGVESFSIESVKKIVDDKYAYYVKISGFDSNFSFDDLIELIIYDNGSVDVPRSLEKYKIDTQALRQFVLNYQERLNQI